MYMLSKLERLDTRVVVGSVFVFTAVLVALVWTLYASDAESTQESKGYSSLQGPDSSDSDLSGWRVPPTAMARDNPELGLRPSGARVVYRDSTKAVAAVPATKTPCLITRYKGGSEALNCGTTDGMTANVSYDGAIGLVPDVVKSVSFTMSDGSQKTQRVVDNLWKSPVEAASVEFVLRGQPRQIDLLPRSSLPEDARVSSDGVVTRGTPPEGFFD